MIFLPAAPGTWEAPLLSPLSTRWHPRWEFELPNAVLGSEIIIVAGFKNENPIWMRGKKNQRAKEVEFSRVLLPSHRGAALSGVSSTTSAECWATRTGK